MCAEALGLNVFAIGWSKSTDFFAAYRRLYRQTFPVMSDFINWCAAPERDTDALISFADFWSLMGKKLPAGTHALDHYIGATAHHLMTKHNVPKRMTYRQLLQFIWSQPATKQCPVKFPVFAFAAEKSDKEWVQ